MNYCEDCKRCFYEFECPICGRPLREVQGEDFVHFCDGNTFAYEQIRALLANQGIEAAFLMQETPAHAYSGSTIGNGSIYVRYQDYERAKEIYAEVYGEGTSFESKLARLLDHQADWHYEWNAHTEKKARKRLGIGKEEDIFAAVARCLEDADKIHDGGKVEGYGSPEKDVGNYWFVYTEDLVIPFNSMTFELYSINKR